MKHFLVTALYRSQQVQFIVSCSGNSQPTDMFVHQKVCFQEQSSIPAAEISWSCKEVELLEKIMSPLKQYEMPDTGTLSAEAYHLSRLLATGNVN